MKIALCCIAKNENQYFKEWIEHHKSVGFDSIIIYDNNSEIPVNEDAIIIKWEDSLYGSQSRAYLDCCRKYEYYDYIAFFDVDEFYYSKSINVKQDIKNLGKPDGVGIYWRIYGQPEPFIEERQPMKDYKYYFGDKHIKSIVNPKMVVSWNDPHKANIRQGCKYIDELNRIVYNPTGEHTSVNMYIKHVFTRSRKEFAEKIERGDANTRTKNRTWDDFYNYNNLCILKDED